MSHQTHTPADLTPRRPSVWSRFKSWLSQPATIRGVIDAVMFFGAWYFLALMWPR